MTKTNRTIADTARALAVEHHRDQLYGRSNLPFTHHLTAVAGLVALYTEDQTTVAAAWLHDIVEDTEIEVGDIRAAYGDELADIVDRLTDPSGLTRRMAKEIAIPRAAECPKAALVRLADRFVNHHHTIVQQQRHYAEIYLGEFDHFMMHMYRNGRDTLPLFRMVGDQQQALRRLVELRDLAVV